MDFSDTDLSLFAYLEKADPCHETDKVMKSSPYATGVKELPPEDPMTTFTADLDCLEPELVAAFPTPPHEFDAPQKSPMMSVSPSSGSEQVSNEFTCINFSDLLESENNLFNGELQGIDDQEIIDVEEDAIREVSQIMSQNISPSTNSDYCDAKYETSSNEATVMVVSQPKKYVLRSRANAEVMNKPSAPIPSSVTYGGKKRTYEESLESEDYNMDDKGSKAAIQARLNRQKKKAFIQDLESKVKNLSEENESLIVKNKKLDRERNSLLEEVSYLKSVIANDSQLAGLLQNISSSKGVHLTSSFSSIVGHPDHDHAYGKTVKRSRQQIPAMTSGVCLHVDQNRVSMEFCPKCAQMAKGAGRDILKS